MAHKGAQQDQRQGRSKSVTEVTEAGSPGPKSSRLTLRNGVWYVGDKRGGDFRDALKKTLQTAELAAAPPLKKPKKNWYRYPPPERLETRPWWNTFLKDRSIREAARIVREMSAKDREAERIWDAVAKSGVKSATLRERFLAKAVGGLRPPQYQKLPRWQLSHAARVVLKYQKLPRWQLFNSGNGEMAALPIGDEQQVISLSHPKERALHGCASRLTAFALRPFGTLPGYQIVSPPFNYRKAHPPKGYPIPKSCQRGNFETGGVR